MDKTETDGTSVISLQDFRDRVKKATNDQCDLADRIEQIKQSLQRINNLMQDLRGGAQR